MRTTLALDVDALKLARDYADTRSVSLGKAVSELVRRGANLRQPTRMMNGLLVFDLPKDSPRVSSALVKRLGEEED
jgi:hypothetical protein